MDSASKKKKIDTPYDYKYLPHISKNGRSLIVRRVPRELCGTGLKSGSHIGDAMSRKCDAGDL